MASGHGANFPAEAKSVLTRHYHIKHDQIRLQPAERGKYLISINHFFDPEAFCFKRISYKGTDETVIIGNKHQRSAILRSVFQN